MSKFEDLKRQLMDEISIDTKKSKEENISEILLVASGIAAAVAVQPIPFADFPILTAIEVVMVKRIGEVYGFAFSFDRTKEILIELGSVVGLAILAKNLILTGYKTVIPFAGGFFTIPLVFGSCYAIGRVADYYFKCRFDNVKFDKSMARKIFKKAKKWGEELGKDKENIGEL